LPTERPCIGGSWRVLARLGARGRGTRCGRRLATDSCCGPVEVWNVSTGKHRFTRPVVDGKTTWVQTLGWSDSGDLLAIAVNGYKRGDGETVILDRSGAQLAALPEDPGQMPRSVSFSPDGHLLATTRWGFASFVDPTDMNTRIWDWQRGEVVTTLNTFAKLAVFDPTANASPPPTLKREGRTSGTPRPATRS
jgi:WD40 repeat protein